MGWTLHLELLCKPGCGGWPGKWINWKILIISIVASPSPISSSRSKDQINTNARGWLVTDFSLDPMTAVLISWLDISFVLFFFIWVIDTSHLIGIVFTPLTKGGYIYLISTFILYWPYRLASAISNLNSLALVYINEWMILTKTNGRVQCLRMMQADSDEMFVSVHVAEASRLGSNLYVCFCTSCQLLYAFYLL